MGYISTQSGGNYLYKKLKTILLHYIFVILKLGSLSWSGHQFHIACPSLELIYKGVLPEMMPRGPEFLSRGIIDKILPAESYTIKIKPLDKISASVGHISLYQHHAALGLVLIISG